MSKNSVSSVVPAVQSTSLGIPLSYQRTATRTNLNPPPGQSAEIVLKRPTFTTTKKGQVAWKKSLVVVDVLPSEEIEKSPKCICRSPKKLRRSVKYKAY